MANYVSSRALVDLLRTADPSGQMYVSVLDKGRLVLGIDPSKPTTLIDISSETTSALNGAGATALPTRTTSITDTATTQSSHVAGVGRTSGSHWIEIKGRRYQCRSVKEVLLTGLRELDSISVGTLVKLSNMRKRTRRIVARDRSELFESKHLVQDHSEQLKDGWWVGTNNSSPESNRWLELATNCAGLKWGVDVKTSL